MTEALVGFAFPFRISNGSVKRAAGPEKIAQDLHHLLITRLGERPMLRTYGGGLHHRLQEPNDSVLQAIIGHEIEQALMTYMPDVRLTGPIQLTSREGELEVVVFYQADLDGIVRRLGMRI